MKRRLSLNVSLILITATSAFSLPALSESPREGILPPKTTVSTQTKKGVPVRDFGRLPLCFESNQGQTNGEVRFLTHRGDSALFLTPTEAVFTMPAQPRRRSPTQTSLHHGPKARRAAQTSAQVALRMQMVGADPSASVLQQQPLPGRINYFLGKDPSKWHAGVPTFGRVGFHAVYPGIDLIYYGNQRHLEYDFLVAPHADPGQITLHFAGAQGVHLNAAGDLVVRMVDRELKWQKPTVYQQDKTGKHAVAARFRLKRLPSGQAGVSFALGRYDASRPVVIDPVLLYSTFLSGSVQDQANGIAVDSYGNAYVTGLAYSSDFPVTSGAFQRGNRGQPGFAYNAFVTKLNAAGTALVYSTYLGGSVGATGDQANGIVVDSSGTAYVTGTASSSDFPTTPGAFQQVNNARGTSATNAFVTRLNATGTALLYSTYLGGTGGGIGDQATSIAVDKNGNAYVTGYTGSFDFPTTPGAFQRAHNGLSRSLTAFVTKLNSTGTALLYSTYLGGSDFDEAYGIAVDNGGNAYVTGNAGSPDFPTTPGAFQRVKHGQAHAGVDTATENAFITKFNSTGAALLYSTYLGGSSNQGGDYTTAIAIDSAGNAYVCGVAQSPDFPTTPGAFQPLQHAQFVADNAFVTKLNSTGSALLYSTFLGGTGNDDRANGIAIDSIGNAYVTGSSSSADFPTTPGALQRVRSGSNDAFVTKLNSTGTTLLYSTYLGGAGSMWERDNATGIAVDSRGNAYITGVTSSIDFPTTPGAFQRVNKAQAPGAYTSFAAKLSAVPILPDLNNDGFTDLLIQNASTGVIASWFMQGSTWVGDAYFSLTPPIEYALVGAGDFSGNGAITLVLQSRTTNQVAFWYTTGGNNAVIPSGNFVNITPVPGWKVVGIGDFNGDGKSDLVFQNQTTGQIAIWFMNGYLYQGGVLLPFTPPTGWTVAGVGDFNTDGFPDIAFQNQTTGQIVLWYMNGSTYVGGTVLTTVPSSDWKVVGVGDYNGDGSADLLFQNQASNQATVWYLKNGAFAGGDTLSLAPPPGWKIVGPR